MKSIRFSYDAEGDILEATFSLGEAGQRTGVELSDHIVVFADHTLSRTTGLTLLSYSKLLLLPHLVLDGLSYLPEDKVEKIFGLLQSAPLVNFLQVVDRKRLFCKVLNPKVQELVEIDP